MAPTRDILRRYGPSIAQGDSWGTLSFGYIAVAVLNGALRPVLATWHPRLQSFEAHKPDDVSIVDHESAWPLADELRSELN